MAFRAFFPFVQAGKCVKTQSGSTYFATPTLTLSPLQTTRFLFNTNTGRFRISKVHMEEADIHR
jgi:hypothetical protein